MLANVRRCRKCNGFIERIPHSIKFYDNFISLNFFAVRHNSTKEIFHSVVSTSAISQEYPEPPIPLPNKSLTEMFANGESVLENLELWSYFTPPSYFRWGLEYMHYWTDLPWWATIMLGTGLLRLLFVYVPIMAQKNAATMSKYKPELDEFTYRLEDARQEGNNMLMQQIMVEKHDFMKRKGVNIIKQLPFMLSSGFIFSVQYFALKKMADASFPGFSTEGIYWFKDLAACDPYCILPFISGITTHFVVKSGTEYGSSEIMTDTMRYGLLYAVPGFIIIAGTQFPAAITLYWGTSNLISLLFGTLFKMKFVRQKLNIPEFVKYEKKASDMTHIMKMLKARSSKQDTEPSLTTLKERDADEFRKAGQLSRRKVSVGNPQQKNIS